MPEAPSTRHWDSAVRIPCRSQRIVGPLCSREMRATRSIGSVKGTMAVSRGDAKQNLTVSLTRDVLRKAKILAAKRKTSISRLLSQEIEFLVSSEEQYKMAERQALALLDKGFHLSGAVRVSRDELHER